MGWEGLHIVYSCFHIIISWTSQITSEDSLSLSCQTGLGECSVSALLSFVSRDKRRKRSLCDDLCCLDQRGEVGYALCLFQCTDLFVRMCRWPPQPEPVLGLVGVNHPWAPDFMQKWDAEAPWGTRQWLGGGTGLGCGAAVAFRRPLAQSALRFAQTGKIKACNSGRPNILSSAVPLFITHHPPPLWPPPTPPPLFPVLPCCRAWPYMERS